MDTILLFIKAWTPLAICIIAVIMAIKSTWHK